jgi:hypothetical protein
MATTYQALSGSTATAPIKIAADASPGTILHTASATPTDYDLLALFAYNRSLGDVMLTLQVAGTTSDHEHVFFLPAGREVVIGGTTYTIDGPYVRIWPGLYLGTSKLLRAYATTANVIYVVGHVEQVT